MVTRNLTPWQKDYRKEVSRLNSMANKRIKRLQASGFKESPALKKWEKSGGKYFSIRGKTQQEARREFYRVREYLDADTSSITGTKKILKSMADRTGQVYTSLVDLQEDSKAFFELSNKIGEYLHVKGLGSQALESTRLWQAINHYTEINNVSIKSGNVDELVSKISDMIIQERESDNQASTTFLEFDWKKLSK